MARNDPQINIRIPETLKRRLEASAAENNRTVTSEVTYLIESALDYIDHLKFNGGAPTTPTDAPGDVAPLLAQPISELLLELRELKASLVEVRSGGGSKEYTFAVKPTGRGDNNVPFNDETEEQMLLRFKAMASHLGYDLKKRK